MSSLNSPHRGASLSEMAPTGTRIPNDAGLQNTIPSIPRPDQRSEHPQFTSQNLLNPDPASAADNPRDLPRSTKDMGASGEVISGTGDTMPAGVEGKRIEVGANDPGARGSARTRKHGKMNRSAFDRFAKEDGNSGDLVGGEHWGRNLE